MPISTDYLSQDDESEARRVAENNVQNEGVGDTIFLDTDDVRQYSLHDYGIGMGLDNGPIK